MSRFNMKGIRVGAVVCSPGRAQQPDWRGIKARYTGFRARLPTMVSTPLTLRSEFALERISIGRPLWHLSLAETSRLVSLMRCGS